MKLAILVTIVGNFGKKGFYHSQEIGLGKALKNLGHEVTIYKCIPKENDHSSIEIEENLRIWYIPVRSIGPHGYFNPKLLPGNTDGVLAFSDTQLFINRVYKYCVRERIIFVPYVGIAHSFQNNLKSKLMDLIYHISTLQIYRQLSVQAKTIAVKNELLEQGVMNVEVTPVGLDLDILNTEFYEYDRNQIREGFGYKPSDRVLSFIARLSGEKKPLELLELFNGLTKDSKYKLLIVGSGPLAPQMQDKIHELGIEERVTILKSVPYEDMWKIHYCSDYFLSLRPDEIFGMAIMEAVYYCSTVLAISAPGPDTILEDLSGHYLCNEYDEIVSYIREEPINEDQLETSRKEFINRFSWGQCAKVFVKQVSLRREMKC